MKINKTPRSQLGYTLIELLVVTTIIIVLSAIGIVSYTNAGQSSRNSKRKTELENVRQALVLRKTDGSAYPAAIGYTAVNYNDLIEFNLLPEEYIGQPTPVDPKNDATYYYSYGSDGVDFCLCAQTEGTTKGNATNRSCGFGTGDFYCVVNP